MHVEKINMFMKLDYFDESSGRQFEGRILQYHEANKNNHVDSLLEPKQIIDNWLKTIEHLKIFVSSLKPLYLKACGNHNIFQRSLSNNSRAYLLFHLLVGMSTPNCTIYTFNYWDNLVVQFILSWCTYKNYSIKLGTLFQIVDMINGDQQYNLEKSI